MNIRILFFILLGLCGGKSALAQGADYSYYNTDIQLSVIENTDTLKITPPTTETVQPHESRRFVAAVLCLTLGPFGMHRLYLGTTPAVAAAYSVTLGAIGIVPVVDFLLITFSKDISRFKNNDKVIMWKR